MSTGGDANDFFCCELVAVVTFDVGHASQNKRDHGVRLNQCNAILPTIREAEFNLLSLFDPSKISLF